LHRKVIELQYSDIYTLSTSIIAEIQVLDMFIYTMLITVGVDKKQLITVWKIADKGY